MRGRGTVAALVFVASLLAVPSAGARSHFPSAPESLTVGASTHAAGARPVRLTLTFRYEMKCNYPGAGPLVVTFPPAVRLPKRFAAGSVTLAGKPLAAKRNQRHVTMTVPRPTGVVCGVIAPGSVKLVFTRKARLGNPARPGSYRFSATHLTHDFSGTLAIK